MTATSNRQKTDMISDYFVTYFQLAIATPPAGTQHSVTESVASASVARASAVTSVTGVHAATLATSRAAKNAESALTTGMISFLNFEVRLKR